jgi:ankyrin repeat protein
MLASVNGYSCATEIVALLRDRGANIEATDNVRTPKHSTLY